MRKVYLCCLTSFLLLLYVCWWSWNESGIPSDHPKNVETVFNTGIPYTTVNLAAVGDLVMHMPIVHSALNVNNGSYDFRPIFAEVRASINQADLAVGVLETQLAVTDSNYSGYPAFRSPASIADALKWTGIKLVFTAHNHSFDEGAGGLKDTLCYLESINLPYVGCRYDPNQKRYYIIDCKGIRLAFLAYTTAINGLSLPAGQEWMVNLYDRSKILEDIREANADGADCIIMALHGGIEYQRTPSKEQQKMVDWLIKSGVDIVLGSHVHVVQPIETKSMMDAGDGQLRDCFIAYSLGNFLSNQRWRYSDYGLLVNLTLEKKLGRSGVRITQHSYEPLWVYRYIEQGTYHYRIVKLTGTNDNVSVPLNDTVARRRIAEVKQETDVLMRDWQNRNH